MLKDHHQQQQPDSSLWESTVRKAQQHPPGRRRATFMSSSAVAPSDDQEEEEGKETTTHHAERLLPNGDFYTGNWRGRLPHGTGKYLWTDGCSYEGEWRRGRTTGRGKFSWPSGATYDGEFTSGLMHGFGTYTGPSGDTYRGLWHRNLKHGPGKRSYPNGDFYDGEWRHGLQDGHGRYVWRSGAEYVGEWRNGRTHGRGYLVWANGNRYDGGWADGSPRGTGSFRWADGGLYVGVWSPGDQKGVYYPSPAASSPTARDPQAAFSSEDCNVCPGENVGILPSQKSLSWGGPDTASAQFTDPCSRRRANTVIGIDIGQRSFDRICIWEADGDITCDIVDGSAVAAAAGSGPLPRGIRMDDRTSGTLQQQRRPPRETKKQGITISKGHKTYELMLNLQLGIRHAVGKQQGMGKKSLELKGSAFDPKEKVWTRFPPEGTKHTPPHQSSEFRWKDYCPLVFRTLRRLFKVDAADYMISICGDDALRELSSPGKSGSFFYLTNDDRYMIKTMKKAEVKVLLKMLPAYYNHVRAFENTLVTKFFGLHCVKLGGATQKKVRFVIMGNLFCTEYPIHRRFDLKGSSHGRTTDKSEMEIDENTTLKDLDLNFIFRLQKSWFQEFHRQVDKDCEFLEQERVMDYSLLVGLHFRDSGEMPSTEDIDNAKEEAPRASRTDMDKFLHDFTRCTVKLGMNMPARVEHTMRRSGSESQLINKPTGELYDVVLFFGIIDILQDYDISKKLEHAYKSMQYDPTSISAVDPKQYSKRFRDFIFRVFTEDP